MPKKDITSAVAKAAYAAASAKPKDEKRDKHKYIRVFVLEYRVPVDVDIENGIDRVMEVGSEFGAMNIIDETILKAAL